MPWFESSSKAGRAQLMAPKLGFGSPPVFRVQNCGFGEILTKEIRSRAIAEEILTRSEYHPKAESKSQGGDDLGQLNSVPRLRVGSGGGVERGSEL